MEPVLQIKHLSVGFDTKAGEIEAVRDVSLTLHKGEILAIVGESGCGKSALCKSVMKLLPQHAHIKTGQIIAAGQEITHFSERQMRALRGSLFSMVFQDPLTSLNPTIPVGEQIVEAILQHHKVGRNEARQRMLTLLRRVGIDAPEERAGLQPHFFSGGMRQRCVLAVALACEPQILFLDEPTTALDVTLQARVIDLLRALRKELEISMVFVSHDLGVVARLADRVAVMYAGKIVEIGTAEEIFYDPRHPYTWGLMGALPALAQKGGRLYAICGMPPSLLHPPRGDAFAERNIHALQIDYEKMPPLFQISDTHYAATWLLDARAPQIEPPQCLLRRKWNA